MSDAIRLATKIHDTARSVLTPLLVAFIREKWPVELRKIVLKEVIAQCQKQLDEMR